MSKYRRLLKDLNYIQNENDNDKVQNLLKLPRKDNKLNTPHTTCPTDNYIHQIDTLFLPEDNTIIPQDITIDIADMKKVNRILVTNKQKPFKKPPAYKYCLVVVDIATGKIDAEPMKYKYSFITKNALIRIYKRKILTLPHEIEVDAGTEFKDEFANYFNNISIIRTKLSGRHRAQAVVEGINSIISKLVQTRQIGEELNTNEVSVTWVSELSNIVKYINKHFEHTPPKINPTTDIPIKCKKGTTACDIFEIGTNVRIQLDNPIDTINSKRLHGKFRIGDIRWENKIRKITQIFLRPNFPPMYKVDNINVAYTKNQLQEVKNNENLPNSQLQRHYVIDRLLKRYKINNKIVFDVLWADKSITQEPRTNLILDVPDLVKQFENRNSLS